MLYMDLYFQITGNSYKCASGHISCVKTKVWWKYLVMCNSFAWAWSTQVGLLFSWSETTQSRKAWSVLDNVQWAATGAVQSDNHSAPVTVQDGIPISKTSLVRVSLFLKVQHACSSSSWWVWKLTSFLCILVWWPHLCRLVPPSLSCSLTAPGTCTKRQR